MFDLYARLESITIVLFADFLYNIKPLIEDCRLDANYNISHTIKQMLLPYLVHFMIELLELGFRLLSPFHDKGFESELFLLLSRVFTKVNLQFGDDICVFDVLMYCEL
jgi:hypothetical protein